MKQPSNYKSWYYEVIHYVPTTPRGGGDITWERHSEYREICLPLEVEEPAVYLSDIAMERQVDLTEYNFISGTNEGGESVSA